VTETAEAKRQRLSEAGAAGIRKRLDGADEAARAAHIAPAREGLRRLREKEQAIDPDGLLHPRERRAAARLLIDIENREQQFAALTERIIQTRRDDLAARRAQFRQLTALVAA
jgi:hypothetical protein